MLQSLGLVLALRANLVLLIDGTAPVVIDVGNLTQEACEPVVSLLLLLVRELQLGELLLELLSRGGVLLCWLAVLLLSGSSLLRCFLRCLALRL